MKKFKRNDKENQEKIHEIKARKMTKKINTNKGKIKKKRTRKSRNNRRFLIFLE